MVWGGRSIYGRELKQWSSNWQMGMVVGDDDAHDDDNDDGDDDDGSGDGDYDDDNNFRLTKIIF